MIVLINKHVINKPKRELLGKALNQPWEPVDVNSFEDFKQIIQNGYAHCVSVFEPYTERTTKNFKYANYCYIDIDNKPPDEDGRLLSPHISIQDALENPLIQQFAWFIATSPSHTEGLHRFHIYFKFDPPELPKNPTEFTYLVKKLQQLLKDNDIQAVDSQVSDAVRFSFGNSNAQFYLINDNNTISRSKLAPLVQLSAFEDNFTQSIHINSSDKVTIEQIEFLLSYIDRDLIRLPHDPWAFVISAVGNTLNDNELANKIITKYIPNEKPGETYYKLLKRTKRHTIGTLFFYAIVCYAVVQKNIPFERASAEWRTHAAEFMAIYNKHFPKSNLITNKYNLISQDELTYWKVTANKRTGEEKISLNEGKLFNLVEQEGFCLLENEFNASELKYVRITNHLIEDASLTHIRNLFTTTSSQYVQNIINTFEDAQKNDILGTIRKQVPATLNNETLSFLPIIRQQKLKDTRDASYFTFRNGVVRVTADEIKLLPFTQFPNFTFWRNSVIDFNIFVPDNVVKFLKENEKHLYYNEYLKKLCTLREYEKGKLKLTFDKKRYDALLSGIGYILHRYKDPATPALLYVTETPSVDAERADGGTGKSLLFRLLANLRNLLEIDGKKITNIHNSPFFFQNLTNSTEIVYIDDANKKFDIEQLYSILTNSITVEQKYKSAYKIPYSEAPKFALSTNYPTGAANDSDLRRRHVVELHRYFSREHSPLVEFGHYFIEDWDERLWQLFYLTNFVIVQMFLKNDRKLTNYETDTYKFAQLRNQTNPDFVQFVTTLEFGVWYSKTWLRHQWADFIGADKLTHGLNTKLGIYLTKYASIYKYRLHYEQKQIKTRMERYVMITETPEKPEKPKYVDFENEFVKF